MKIVITLYTSTYYHFTRHFFLFLQKKRELSPQTDCIVCYKTPMDRVGRKKNKKNEKKDRLFTYCKQCSAYICLPCLQKIEVYGYHKCPQCRYLFIEGPTWGAPYEEKTQKNITRIVQQKQIADMKYCISKLLPESLKMGIRFINVFVVHKTYKIHREKEMPIKKIAAFRFSTRLYQEHNRFSKETTSACMCDVYRSKTGLDTV